MSELSRSLISLALLLTVCVGRAVTVTPEELDLARRFTTAKFETVRPSEAPAVEGRSNPLYGTNAPFSFTYDGRPSSQWLAEWSVRREARNLDHERRELSLSWTDSRTGLEVRCVAVQYRDFPTVEWTLWFCNRGANDTPILEDIQALEVEVDRGVQPEFRLHHNRGDSNTANSYEPLETPLPPKTDRRFAPEGGRPTNGRWPHFNLQWGSEGLIIGVGWPGQWAASFTRDERTSLRLRSGQELTRFKLRPGEAARAPLVVLQFWRGDRVRAQNLWRRWMLAHNTPRPAGKPPPPMLTSCSGGFFPGLKCNEADELRFIDAFSREGIRLDYWWMDAGWYPCPEWSRVGTWEIDQARFPRGLKAISDRLHAQGTKLIVWFEPERATPGSWVAENHPEWVLGGKNGGLLNLGDSQAREWLTEHVDALLTSQGIDLYRQDFNIDPLPYWRAHDTPDRQGLTEIHHVEGYLAYWDELRRRHPNLLIDSCASGGRRNDLETLRRAVPLLRSDYQSFQGDPGFAPGNQGHTYGLSAWLPYYGQGAYYNPRQLLYAARSHFCPAFGFCVDVRQPGVDWARFRGLTEDWRKVADFLLGDYYPLTPYSLADESWIAWQFARPDLGAGVVQAFRRAQSIYESARFKLRGLEADARYTVTNLDEPESVKELTGRELMETGLLVTAPTLPSALILVYQQKP